MSAYDAAGTRYEARSVLILKKKEFRERNSGNLQNPSNRLCRQNFSAFRSSGSKYLSSVSGAHSCSEAMNLGSGSFLRLKCHFHRGVPPLLPNLSIIIGLFLMKQRKHRVHYNIKWFQVKNIILWFCASESTTSLPFPGKAVRTVRSTAGTLPLHLMPAVLSFCDIYHIMNIYIL